MNARSYRINLCHSPLDFRTIIGLGQSSVSYRSEPPQIVNNKVLLAITKAYILTDMNTNKEYQVLAAQSVYEIPCNEIKSREDVYEFFKDATLGLNEAYQYFQIQLPTLLNISFPTPEIGNLKQEIDGVLYITDSQN
jgi:hypothetical protein